MFRRSDIRGARHGMLVTAVAVLAATVGVMTYLELPKADRLHGQSAPRDVVPSEAAVFDHQDTLTRMGIAL